MIKKVSNKIIQNNIKLFGNKIITYYVIEELSELQKELTKDMRGKGCLEDIKEELSDVYYVISMLEQNTGLNLQYEHYDISKDIVKTLDINIRLKAIHDMATLQCLLTKKENSNIITSRNQITNAIQNILDSLELLMAEYNISVKEVNISIEKKELRATNSMINDLDKIKNLS